MKTPRPSETVPRSGAAFSEAPSAALIEKGYPPESTGNARDRPARRRIWRRAGAPGVGERAYTRMPPPPLRRNEMLALVPLAGASPDRFPPMFGQFPSW